MKRTALLRTRCGCQQYMEVDPSLRVIRKGLLPDFKVPPPKIQPAANVEFRIREFALDGRTADGIYIYTEVYSE